MDDAILVQTRISINPFLCSNRRHIHTYRIESFGIGKEVDNISLAHNIYPTNLRTQPPALTIVTYRIEPCPVYKEVDRVRYNLAVVDVPHDEMRFRQHVT